MLSGNPHAFAIWCDAVEPWSTPEFANGCLGYFMGERLVWSSNSTLEVDLSMLSRLRCMKNSVEDGDLFHLSPQDAYRELCNRTFPSVNSGTESNDFTHLVSAESLSDAGHYIFLVEYDESAKLIYGFKENSREASEVVLVRGEFQSVVRDVLAKFPKEFNAGNL
ncbi:immunity 42 family protein [Burkholderia cenocepacia]|uniref:immunity 42 family protein n=1 Tax=Burkholderia cepacia complex TaxID=87882 RepID=UPI001B999F35|nr:MULTISPECIES: immunity 42 family protein [Burkholderia cepacia complex]MBR8037525.1 immunity 42 family protein [Burkholderia cenocepacia]MBR8324898.1 immunity 42 family protein [Burkholderia cenocepacia]MDN7577744.1 immunity 42 family protein [Burkholderia orbicola]MDN7579843.1 immunity 42 family protein [Burkholderia orbicola]